MIRRAEAAHDGSKVQHISLQSHVYAALVRECEPRSPSEVLGVDIEVMTDEEEERRGTLH